MTQVNHSSEAIHDKSPLRLNSDNLNYYVKVEDNGSSSAEPRLHEGLNTSLSSIFQDASFSRVDCCSITCCGLLQSDYNRYLLFHKRPPSFVNRLVQYILIPLALFCSAGYAAVMIKDPRWNETICSFLLIMSIFWVIGSCLSSTHKRILLRREVMRRVRTVLNIAYTSPGREETTGEMYCVHRLCGCFRVDEMWDNGEEERSYYYNNNWSQNNFCARISRMYRNICCGKLLGCQVQCIGSCALAQESRQLEILIPQEQRRFDYITFESYFQYFNDIRKLRMEKNEKLVDHYRALSELSRSLVKALLSVTTGLLTFSILLSPQSFQIGNMLVFLATFLQAFIILYFVHWHSHKFDISLDAVIKYFACGFVLTTSSAVMFEIIESVFLQILFRMLMTVLGVQVKEQGGYQYIGKFTFIHDSLSVHASSAEKYKNEFNKEYPLIAIVFLFISAFGVAALVEELSKYFGYKIVDHPDFIKEDDLQVAATYGIPFQINELNESVSYEWGGGLDCALKDDISEEGHTVLSAEIRSTGHMAESNTPVRLQDTCPRSTVSLRAAITVAMVSVALGFACCENLIYIYFYTGQSLDMEISVLISRSLFPIHPICAAIQSIGVCKQVLEKDTTIGIGRIIFPAVLLHGSYDFVIMLLSFVASIRRNNEERGDEEEEQLVINMIAMISSVLFVAFGAVHFVRESKAQRLRLEQMDSAQQILC